MSAEQDFIKANCSSFGDDIGAVTNRITAMFDVASTFPVGNKQREILEYRIMCGQQFQQNSIIKVPICGDIYSKSGEPVNAGCASIVTC